MGNAYGIMNKSWSGDKDENSSRATVLNSRAIQVQSCVNRNIVFRAPPAIILYAQPDVALTDIGSDLSKRLNFPLLPTHVAQRQFKSLANDAEVQDGLITFRFPSSVNEIIEFIDVYKDFSIIPLFIMKPLEKDLSEYSPVDVFNVRPKEYLGRQSEDAALFQYLNNEAVVKAYFKAEEHTHSNLFPREIEYDPNPIVVVENILVALCKITGNRSYRAKYQ